MKHITLRDTELAYIERGHGIPVVFVHGSVSDYRAWRLQISHFSHRYRAIAYSRRYHFPNPLPPSPSAYSAAVHADDLLAFLDAHRIDRAHIVGASFGGYVSLVFALRFPERVLSLTLAEPPILPFLLRTEAGKVLFEAFMNNAWLPARRAMVEGKTKEGVRLFINGVMGDGAFEGFTLPAQKCLIENAEDLRLETTSEEYFTEVRVEQLRSCRVPVLLLNGENSLPMFARMTDVLGEFLPHVNRVTIANASHGMNVQNAEVFNQVVGKFLVSSSIAR